MKIKTGITKIDGKYSAWFQIGGDKFILYPRRTEDVAEWDKEQFKDAIKYNLRSKE